LKATTAANRRTTFFPKVCKLDNTIASPKQPQSDIGFAMANQNVNNVMNDKKMRDNIVDKRLRKPKKK
jgi:hypothetical protein